jgi:hypothetical protein
MAAVKGRFSLWFERVGSSDNISDDPSRESYASMVTLSAKFVSPKRGVAIATALDWRAMSEASIDAIVC